MTNKHLLELGLKILGVYLIVMFFGQLHNLLTAAYTWSQTLKYLEVSSPFPGNFLVPAFTYLIGMSVFIRLCLFKTDKVIHWIASDTSRREVMFSGKPQPVYLGVILALGLWAIIDAFPSLGVNLVKEIHWVQSGGEPLPSYIHPLTHPAMQTGIGILLLVFAPNLSRYFAKYAELPKDDIHDDAQ